MNTATRIIDGKSVCHHAPFLFTLAQAGIGRNIKGSWRLLTLLQKTLLRNTITAYDLDGVRPVTLYAPLFRPESCLSQRDIETYDDATFKDIAMILQKHNEGEGKPVWFVDAGADIGIICAQALRSIKNIETIFAYEPNDVARPYLEAMLEENGIPYTVYNAALGQRECHGRLVSPPNDPSDHARYFEEHENGPIRMTCLNTLPSPEDKTVIVKIDVEGAERDVIAGARDFLSKAYHFIIVFEAHPKVFARTNTNADDIVDLLNTIRPCATSLAGSPDLTFHNGQPLEAQIPNFEDSNHNIICASIA